MPTSVTSPVPANCTDDHAVAKLLISDRICPDSVLILGSIFARETTAADCRPTRRCIKLETSAERKTAQGEKLLEGLEYYPSGSVVDGSGAALLARCQIFNIRATMCAFMASI